MKPKLRAASPHLFVRDLASSLEYFRKALGFEMAQPVGEPPQFATPSRDGLVFVLQQAREGMSARHPDRGDSWDVYVWVEEPDDLFDEFQSNGARIVQPPRFRDSYFGKGRYTREFAVRDLDEHILAFGQDFNSYSTPQPVPVATPIPVPGRR